MSQLTAQEITKEVINTGLTQTYVTVVLSDGINDVIVQRDNYSQMRMQGYTDPDIFGIGVNA